jgi:hypothetical protein
VKRALFTWLFYAVLATIAFFVARMLAPGRQELELDIYVLALGGFGLMVLATALGEVAPREDESLREFDLHYRLRPVLRDIAAARLEQRGAILDSDSPRARELLGDELWSLTEPDREPPSNRQAPGIGFEELERTVERLERL